MDTFKSDYNHEQDKDSEFAYPITDTPTATPTQPRTLGASFGFGLFNALGLGHSTENNAQPVDNASKSKAEEVAQFGGFVEKQTYIDPTPIYRGEYKNLSPLYFDTKAVNNANNTRLDRSKLASYSRSQLFFLLRLERFLRLRYHWLQASPRQDESWKTELVTRGIFSALRDCVDREVGKDAKALLKSWECC